MSRVVEDIKLSQPVSASKALKMAVEKLFGLSSFRTFIIDLGVAVKEFGPSYTLFLSVPRRRVGRIVLVDLPPERRLPSEAVEAAFGDDPPKGVDSYVIGVAIPLSHRERREGLGTVAARVREAASKPLSELQEAAKSVYRALYNAWTRAAESLLRYSGSPILGFDLVVEKSWRKRVDIGVRVSLEKALRIAVTKLVGLMCDELPMIFGVFGHRIYAHSLYLSTPLLSILKRVKECFGYRIASGRVSDDMVNDISSILLDTIDAVQGLDVPTPPAWYITPRTTLVELGTSPGISIAAYPGGILDVETPRGPAMIAPSAVLYFESATFVLAEARDSPVLIAYRTLFPINALRSDDDGLNSVPSPARLDDIVSCVEESSERFTKFLERYWLPTSLRAATKLELLMESLGALA